MADGIHRLYLRESALVKILENLHQSLQDRKPREERMGFLLGKIAQWEGSRFSVAETVITTDLDANNFAGWKKEGLEPGEIRAQVVKASEGSDLVGWYHAHPGYTLKFTRSDVKLHVRLFPEGGGISLVVDPVDMDMRAYVPRRSGMPREVAYAVI